MMRKAPALFVLVLVVSGCDTAPPPTAPSPPPPAQASPTPSPPVPPPESPSDPMVGQYTLTVTHGCEAVPDAARTRTYAARIDPGSTGFVVTLSEATFLAGLICTAAPSGLDCNQFLASRADDQIRFDLINQNDDGHGGHIVEQLLAGTWMELIGSAAGRLQDGTITATGTGIVWYCPTNMGYPFPCVSSMSCESVDLHLTFTRK